MEQCQVDPGTEAQLSEFESIIAQMEKNWPPRAAPVAPAPARPQPAAPTAAATSSPKTKKKCYRGIDEDLKVILDTMDPELMAGSPKVVEVSATPFIPSPKG
jgi:hypothetical protein